MAGQRGRPPKKTNEPTYMCSCCGETKKGKEFYVSFSPAYKLGKLPICRSCLEHLYHHYLKKYLDGGHPVPERDAIRRCCIITDSYYSDRLYATAVKGSENSTKSVLVYQYYKNLHLTQNANKTYDDTMREEAISGAKAAEELAENKSSSDIAIEDIEFFGKGFLDEDYKFLRNQYNDWTSKHECNTKVQEEIFKRLCFVQLDIWKSTLAGDNKTTKDLDKTFLELLASAKLQPKQNAGETLADNQSFGTLINKWETTRPIPEPDEDLKDVDKIGKYIDIFYRGHSAKAMSLNNNFSKLYTDFMKQYSVTKPEYNGDEDNEALFDAIFGRADIEGD